MYRILWTNRMSGYHRVRETFVEEDSAAFGVWMGFDGRYDDGMSGIVVLGIEKVS